MLMKMLSKKTLHLALPSFLILAIAAIITSNNTNLFNFQADADTANPEPKVMNNLLSNPSMEVEVNGEVEAWGARTSNNWDNTIHHYGNASMHVVPATDAYRYSHNTITLEAGKTYVLQGWVKTENASGSGVYIRYAQTNPTPTKVFTTEKLNGTNGWTKVTKTFTLPADYAAGRVDIVWEITAGEAWIDDVALCENECIEGIANKLANSSMEVVVNGDAEAWGARATNNWDNAVYHSETASMHVVPANDGYYYAHQTITLQAGSTYTIQGFIKTENASGSGVYIRYAQTNPTPTKVFTTEKLTGTNDWTKVTKTFTLPADYAAGRVDIVWEINAGEAWIDDVMLCEGNGPCAQDTTALKVCDESIHNKYVTTGPDGQTYATWHPSTDPETGCIFGHEHGNNPESVLPGYKPAFGYTAGRMGMTEPHNGFKVYAFTDYDDESWVVTHHFGTAGRGTLCNQFHTIDVAVGQASGEVLADLHTMADHGRSRFFDGQYMTPAECPDQVNINSFGIRRIPMSPDGYEPWLVNDKIHHLGLNVALNILTSDAIMGCEDPTCSVMKRNGTNTGSRRRFQATVGSNGLQINETVTTTNSGIFYTDSMGHEMRMATDSDSVMQYIKPGYHGEATIARSDQLDAARGGCWYYNGQNAPMGCSTGDLNGADPLLLPTELIGSN